MHLTHKQTLWIGNLIAKASKVIIDIVRVDLVAGFLEHIADPPPLHGDEVDRVLEGENVEQVVVENLSDLQNLVLVTFSPQITSIEDRIPPLLSNAILTIYVQIV